MQEHSLFGVSTIVHYQLLSSTNYHKRLTEVHSTQPEILLLYRSQATFCYTRVGVAFNLSDRSAHYPAHLFYFCMCGVWCANQFPKRLVIRQMALVLNFVWTTSVCRKKRNRKDINSVLSDFVDDFMLSHNGPYFFR